MDVHKNSFMVIIQLQLMTVLCVYQHTSVLLLFYWSRICRLGSEMESLALQAVLLVYPGTWMSTGLQGNVFSHPQLLQPR